MSKVSLAIETEKAGLKQVLLWRKLGKKVGFTNGCFDLLHPGHIALLETSREHCDCLVVGLNSDRSVVKLKGPSRPIQDELSRKIILMALEAVSIVIIFDEETPLRLIKLLNPDILVKGADYEIEEIVGGEHVSSYGGEVFTVPYVEGKSSTALINKFTRKR